jgi:hypothetical protein
MPIKAPSTEALPLEKVFMRNDGVSGPDKLGACSEGSHVLPSLLPAQFHAHASAADAPPLMLLASVRCVFAG